MSEYTLVLPSEEVMKANNKYFDKIQGQKSSPGVILVPAQFGMLIFSDTRKYKMFSVEGVGWEEVYDLESNVASISGAETSYIVTCGVAKLSFGNSRALLHGAGTQPLVRLVSRALDLAMKQGEVAAKGLASVYCNDRDGFSANSFGPDSYSKKLSDFLGKSGLDYQVSNHSVDSSTLIRL